MFYTDLMAEDHHESQPGPLWVGLPRCVCGVTAWFSFESVVSWPTLDKTPTKMSRHIDSVDEVAVAVLCHSECKSSQAGADLGRSSLTDGQDVGP